MKLCQRGSTDSHKADQNSPLALQHFASLIFSLQATGSILCDVKSDLSASQLQKQHYTLVHVPGTSRCAAGSSAGWPWQLPGCCPASSAGQLSSTLCRRTTPALWLCSTAAGRLALTSGSAPPPSYRARPEKPLDKHTAKVTLWYSLQSLKTGTINVYPLCIYTKTFNISHTGLFVNKVFPRWSTVRRSW